MIPLVAALAMAAPARLALVVGVDQYKWVDPNLPREKKLCGAANDVAAMKDTLDLAGFRATPLLQQDATQAAIEKWLKAAADAARSGTEIVFYFSGRGATSLDGRKEPTLVPFDGRKEDDAHDVRMSAIEAMAKQADAKGAHVTIVLDTCFTTLSDRSLEERVYKGIPKLQPRGKDKGVRKPLYRGPGAFLCPVQGEGGTYEWLANAGQGVWTGAFTDYLTGTANLAILARKPRRVRDLMEEAADYFRERTSDRYMPGLEVGLPEGADDPGYDRPFPTAAENLPDPNPALAQRYAREIAYAKAMRDKLRVAIKLDDLSPKADAELGPALRKLAAILRKNPSIMVLGEGAARPDRLLSLSREDGLTVTVVGSDTTGAEKPVYSGGTIEAAAGADLMAYLHKELLVKKLWEFASDDPGPLADRWRPQMVEASIPKNGYIEFEFDAPSPGYVYAFKRGKMDGEIKLIFPSPTEPDPYFGGGRATAPKRIGNGEGSDPGTCALFTLFVPGEAGELPKIADPAESWDNAKRAVYLDPLNAHLEKLLCKLEMEHAPYAAKKLQYELTAFLQPAGTGLQ